VKKFFLILAGLSFPFSLFGEDVYITRREGFLAVWQSVKRATFEPYSPMFKDVNEDGRGYEEITFAQSRGIVDEGEYFMPDDVLTMDDALLWIFRTRNVRDLFYMQKENIAGMLRDYPILEFKESFASSAVSMKDLTGLMYALDKMLAEEEHEVSFYGEDFHGNGTAFGESFDMNALTAAHRLYPSNTLVKVTNIENGKSVIVRVNDRGPFVEGRDMDLSLAAFEKIADRSNGVIRATFQRLGDAFLIDACTEEEAKFQKRITKNVRFHRGIPHIWSKGETLYLGANRFFVIRSITFPDGTVRRVENWVSPDETYKFTPQEPGNYVFIVGNQDGRSRGMRMAVKDCK